MKRPSYGSRVPEPAVSVGSGSGWVGVGNGIGELQPCTTYHYRLYAENTFGEGAYGGDASFLTRGLPKPTVHNIPESWVKYGPTNDYISAIAPCAGAIQKVWMDVPAGGTTVFSQEFPCGCQESVTSSDIDLSGQATGVRSVGAYAEDPWGDMREETPHPNLYIDHTQPVISTSGSATEAKEGQIGEGPYTLAFSADDGNPSAPQSGARGSLDRSRRCPPGTRRERLRTALPHSRPKAATTLSGTPHFTDEELGVGEHKLTVHARDWVGNESEWSTTLVVHPSARQGLGPGSLNLASGDLSLPATDASLPSGPVTLAVARASHSRTATAGVEPALGPGWTLSLPEDGAALAWRSLSQLPNGSALLTSTTGQHYVFQVTSGGYVDPPGLQADELTESGTSPQSYRLADAERHRHDLHTDQRRSRAAAHPRRTGCDGGQPGSIRSPTATRLTAMLPANR